MSTPEAFTVQLPSSGGLYDGNLPGGKATLRPMGAPEEQIIFQRGGDPLAKSSKIIDGCYLDAEKVTPGDLLMIDRLYILFMLRVQMFGPVYRIPFSCQRCNHQRKVDINIMDDLDVTRMGEDLEEPFEVDLPHCGSHIEFRLLRGKDEEEVSRHAKRVMLKSTDAGDPSSRYRIGLQIVTVDGDPVEKQKAVEFAKSLDMADSNEFRLGVEAVEGGIDLMLVHDCEQCGYVNEFLLPFTAEFLQPSTRQT